MSSSVEVGLRRTWPQRLLLLLGLGFAAAVILVSVRLDQFEESMASILRVDVPGGVLADLPGTAEAAATGVPGTLPGGGIDPEGGGAVAVPAESSEDGGSPLRYGPAGPPRNFLLVGTDSAVGMDPDDPAAQRDTSSGVALADVVMLVRVDPGLRRVAVASIPRDLYLPIWRDGVPVREEKLASALIVGGIGRGAPTLVETVSRNFDVPIHDFVVVDFAGFVRVVDELDGVPMWFDQPVRDLGSGLAIREAGCHVMSGSSALAFVRARRLEAFVGGRWRRVGVSNDLERNHRQQDFITLALERLVDRGARSVIVRNDLIEAGVESVILDARLTLRDLIDLGRAFADFRPDDLVRLVLPVHDDVVGESMVLRLLEGDAAEAVFDVFRGVLLRPEEVTVHVVDGRAPGVVGAEGVPVAEQLAAKGFAVESGPEGEAVETVLRVSPNRFEAAVLVVQYLGAFPRFEVDVDLGDAVELTVGNDFAGVLLVPIDRSEVEARARAALPGVLLDDEVGAGAVGAYAVGGGRWSLPRVDLDIDGRPPEGVDCP